MTARMICILSLLGAAAAAAQSLPATQQADWDRFFSPASQRALEDITDGDRTDVGHPAFDVLLEAAQTLSEEQRQATTEVHPDAVLADPAAYRGRLVAFYAVVRRVLGPFEHTDSITGKTGPIWRLDCTAQKGHYLSVWTAEAGGWISPDEGVMVRGFFYKTFAYTPEQGGTPDVGLAVVTRWVKPPEPPPWQMPAWLPYVLGGVFLAVLAVAVTAFALSRRVKKPR